MINDGTVRTGVGRLLFEKLQEICRRRGIARAFVITNERNEAAMAFYRALGATRDPHRRGRLRLRLVVGRIFVAEAAEGRQADTPICRKRERGALQLARCRPVRPGLPYVGRFSLRAPASRASRLLAEDVPLAAALAATDTLDCDAPAAPATAVVASLEPLLAAKRTEVRIVAAPCDRPTASATA